MSGGSLGICNIANIELYFVLFFFFYPFPPPTPHPRLCDSPLEKHCQVCGRQCGPGRFSDTPAVPTCSLDLLAALLNTPTRGLHARPSKAEILGLDIAMNKQTNKTKHSLGDSNVGVRGEGVGDSIENHRDTLIWSNTVKGAFG